MEKRICLLWLALTLAAAGYHEGPLGWRVNGAEIFRTAAEFVVYLKTAGAGSIRLLELSGHGTRVFQSMDDYADKRVFSTIWLKDERLLLLDKNGQQPDPGWAANLKRALAENAVVYFYGCQTGLYDPTGLVDKALSDCVARAFSEEFQVTTIACPEIVYYPDEFPDFEGTFFSNPTIPPTPGFSTQGGIWNVFERGRWVPPRNPAGATTFKVLPRPVIPGGPPRARP